MQVNLCFEKNLDMAAELTNKLKCCENISYNSIKRIESAFYRLGYWIALRPWKTILICWIFTIIASLGLIKFHQEKNPVKLWSPPDSNFVKDTEWLMKTFKKGYRTQTMLIKGTDVLRPEVLRQMNEINRRVLEASSNDGTTYSQVCFKIPFIDKGISAMLNRKSNSTRYEFDPTTDSDMSLYCNILKFLEQGCLQSSILELWEYDDEKMRFLTKEDIINKIMNTKISPYTGHPFNFEKLLGGIKRNESNHIIAAESVISFWMVDVNFTAVDMDQVGNSLGTADWATVPILNWEEEFINVMESSKKNLVAIELLYSAERSFADVSGSTMRQDIAVLMIGIFMMVIYVQVILSKYNCIEVRLSLGSVGLLSIGMAFLVAVSLCSLIGVPYGPVHTSFPFLLMGLGVDDMFVIMACWNQLAENEEKSKPLPERIGIVLQHAGVSITITSITDIIVFIIGSSSAVPTLRSYCVYAATGILFTYIFVITFFIACLTLDQIRIEQNKNGFFPCYEHKEYKPSKCSQVQHSKRIINFIYSNLILTRIGKILVIIATIVFTAVGLNWTLKLEEKFDPMWFIPNSTEFAKYVQQRSYYYPDLGLEAGLYFGQLNYTQEYNKFQSLSNELDNATNIMQVTSSWVEPFQYYMRNYQIDLNEEVLSESDWNKYLSKFLFSPKGAKYIANFQFEKDLVCGEPASKILASNIKIRYRKFLNKDEYLPAMHWTYGIVEKSNFTTGDKFATAWGKLFGNWAIDEVIKNEMVRNLLLALISVMFCTLALIVDLQMCFWIFICVLLTMVTVCGFMYIWGLTIDIVSCIALTLAIGLCVDYAAHIGYSFLTTNLPSREDRILKTMSNIGFAVLNGGISTLLAMSMLSLSEAYTFQAFFKIFFLIVVFGQFYGVVFLPVVLSYLGPKPFRQHKIVSQSEH